MFETIIPGSDHDQTSEQTELVKSASIENLVRVRDDIARRIRDAARLLAEADDLAKAAGLKLRDAEVNAEAVIKAVDASGWDYLMKESGLRSFMDSTARSEWSHKIHEQQVPELTVPNIAHTFQSLHERRSDMLDRGVIAIFKGLSWDYKTNKPCLFGKKIIVERMVSPWGPKSNWFSFHTEGANKLDDLDRVFHKLAKQPEPDHRDGWGSRLERAHRVGGNQQAEGAFMSVKWFKKGTAHIAFKDLAMVDHLNAIIARHFPDALPPPA